MEAMEQRPPILSDPLRAGVAWARYRRMMRWVALTALAAIVVALVYLHAGGGTMTIHLVVATAAGVGLSVLLAGALMLLVFLSSGTGHDEEAGARHEDGR